MYAAVYAVGPMVSTYLTGGDMSGPVWSMVAGATANYVYYWHCREHIAAIKQQSWNDPTQQHAGLKEEGGVQPTHLGRGRILSALLADDVQNASRRRPGCRQGSEDWRRRLAMPKTLALALSLPRDPSLKPAPVLLVLAAPPESAGSPSFFSMLRIRARPVFLPPTLEFIRTIWSVRDGENPSCRAERRNERPVPVLAQPKISKMFPQQEDHPRVQRCASCCA